MPAAPLRAAAQEAHYAAIARRATLYGPIAAAQPPAASLIEYARRDAEDATGGYYEYLEWLAKKCTRYESRILNQSWKYRP